MKKRTFILVISLLCILSTKHIQADTIDPSIPGLPNDYKGVDLKENFNPVVNLGGGFSYSEDNSLLQLTNSTNQATAIWGKNKIDLTKYFKLQFYFYLGDQGANAADGVVFGLQNYSPSFLGDLGNGIGFYNHLAYKVGLEFDTYFNGDGPDSYTGPGGSNGLSNRNNHMAIAGSGQSWTKYQYHYGASQLPDGQYFSNGAWKKVTIEGVPVSGKSTQTTLKYSMYDLSYKTTLSGSCMVDFNSNTSDYSSHHFLLSKDAYWGFTASTGWHSETAAMSFGVLPQKPSIATTDTTIYQGEKWDASKNFVSGNDETATDFEFGDSRLSTTNNVDTTKPGTYNVTYTYNNGGFTGTASAKVTVLEDQTNIKTKDSVLYVGQKWNKESNFVSATDEDGNAIPWSDSRISSNGASVDTSKPGTYNLTYTVKGKLKNVDSKFTVTVKEDKSSIQTRNTTLQVGQIWNKESNFVGATDEDGNAIPWSDSRISSNGASVDTSKPGVTKLRYTYQGKVKNTDSDFTVTVEDPLKLIVPSSSDFGTYKLGSSNTVLLWNKASKVEVEGAINSQWDLSVALNSKSSLKGYMKIGETPITETSQKVLSGTGPMSVTDEVSPGNFIKVDYTGVKQLRKDTGTLQWTLTPSTKGVSE
ncbi:bacterial Ig-like domain-containing protein [Lactococcus garvieae]|nr:bacterial Ig-like domain-containing protein [Lactococcus garvieae]